MTAPAAFAHTAFESSDPADGAARSEPVSVITLVFTGEAEPAGEGFVILDPSGDLRTPDRLTSPDNLSWVLHFDDPIAGGTVGVRWTVAAPDAHPIEGSFSFDVAAPVQEPPLPDAGSAQRDPLSATFIDSPIGAPAASIDEFLDVGSTGAPLAGLFGAFARSVALLGAIVAIGGTVFAAIVLRGSESDIRSVVFWVRRASVLLVLGAVLELLHQLAVINGNWLTVWPLSSYATVLMSPVGVAIGLRMIGGSLMVRAHLDVTGAAATMDPILALQSAVPVGAGPTPARSETTSDGVYVAAGDKAWRVDGDLGLVFGGVAATIAGFAFDGHTVTEGTRLLTSFAAMAHAAAGAVWAGGLLMLAHVVWRRHRRGRASRATQLAVRFSVVAAYALVVTGVAGTLLAVTVLDGVSELWSTGWGRVLVAKLAVVGVAAAAGAHNHTVLIPRMLDHSSSDPDVDAEFRRTLLIEGIAMGAIVALTAVLVASAS